MTSEAESRARAVPPEVAEHLVAGPAGLAWIRLRDGLVVELGGATERQELGAVRPGEPLPEDLPWSALVDGDLPTQVVAVPRREERGAGLSDVHAWEQDGDVFVTLLDASATFGVLGPALQAGNEDELLRERLAGSERLWRDERRTRAEAFGALGYALLELAPDGRFRPAATPADWLVDLCGWDDEEARVIDASDPSSFLGCFLAEAAAFLDPQREAAGSGDGVRALSSGVWTESLERDGRSAETSFEAHALALSSGRGLVAVERLGTDLDVHQRILQGQRDAQLALQSLSQEMQTKEVLLHCIVHDLRGPLSNLVGSLGLLAGTELSEVERQEMIRMGLRQARRQDEMIRHVLDVFGAEVEALRSFEESVEGAPDLALVAQETVDQERAAFRAKGVELTLSGAQDALPVVGVRERLERVLTNLVSNALRHAPAGTTVDLMLQPTGDSTVRASVLDRGPGVPEDLRGRLFERFVQGGSGGAAGLGLYYVRMTVERWGGGVEYEPREGGGAAFHVTLRRPVD